MSKKTLLIIAAVAVMLVAATNAYGDDYSYESWDGWFNSGELDYNGKTYTIVWSVLEVDDSTYTISPPHRDTFGIWVKIPAVAFVCVARPGDSIFVYIDTLTTGGKEYGTSGTKEGEGYWYGDGSQYNEHGQLVKIFDFGGTWEATFNYNTEPDPTYEGTWMVTWSGWPVLVTGDGTCSGKRTYYED
ncbi:hypothetical protein CEE36_08540 [candidate division TA06 bacterium B3_TA06]|uniref:Uncharacterized protein n=1 Tax=candidate division TA06 bacterium B3_TA06 TaxID=2012487 RepID=A0A532V2E3_UNCT6|nr:MAG: hypothetical protein CEE36_08540 [candidate division TA06 bacterium B3_TA06]